MAECKIPVRIDGYKCVEDMIQDVLNYTYKGKTLKEWANSISEPQTNGDRIRAMNDEELAEWFHRIQYDVSDYYCGGHSCEPTLPTGKESWLDWLKREVSE